LKIFNDINYLGSFLPVELSSDSGTQNFHRDIEADLREIRMSLLMEIEKRKQVEESLNSMQSQWEKLRQGLSQVGIVLPADPTAEGGQLSSDPMEDIFQQLYITRFISNSIGRGIARAEVEMEMEAQLELKNFEIARLLERLHCYETMNREMSQRNQEAVGENYVIFLFPSVLISRVYFYLKLNTTILPLMFDKCTFCLKL